MANDYADWSDCWMRDPPQPPQRPSLAAWRRLSEAERFAYDGAVTGYLMASGTPREFETLTNLRLAMLKGRIGGERDGSPPTFAEALNHPANRFSPMWRRGRMWWL
jgi:hypothetical protein